jgi:uncharacterized protein (TIGR03435 family)
MKEAAKVPDGAAGGDGEEEPEFDADGFPNPATFPEGRVWSFTVSGRSRITGKQVSMQDLADALTLLLSRPVTDETALKAKYDFILTFSSAGLSAPAHRPMGESPLNPEELEAARRSAAAQAKDPAPDLFTALQQQVGLKLEPKKGAVELIVIDHAERKPTEN